jgi:hypothetical protein
MHVLSIIAALAVALTIGFATARPAHHAGMPPVMSPFDGGGGDPGSGGTFNGSGPPG